MKLSDGFSFSEGCRLENLSASANGSGDLDAGFRGAANCAVENCTATENNGRGFVFGFGSSIRGSTARRNTGTGIKVDTTTVVDCGANENGGDGH